MKGCAKLAFLLWNQEFQKRECRKDQTNKGPANFKIYKATVFCGFLARSKT